MNDNIIKFEAKKHIKGLSGNALCTLCRHEFHTENVPTGTLWIECPECRTRRAAFYGNIAFAGLIYVCGNCRCNAFQITRYESEDEVLGDIYFMCMSCGYSQPPEEVLGLLCKAEPVLKLVRLDEENDDESQ